MHSAPWASAETRVSCRDLTAWRWRGKKTCCDGDVAGNGGGGGGERDGGGSWEPQARRRLKLPRAQDYLDGAGLQTVYEHGSLDYIDLHVQWVTTPVSY